VATKLLTVEQFARSLDPPRKKYTIHRLLRQGRISGAIKPGRDWLIPRDAKIQGRGERFEDRRRVTGISVGEYAAKNGVSTQRVYQLLWESRIPGAVKTEWGWDIPADAPWPVEESISI
jgi:hypothetical protein